MYDYSLRGGLFILSRNSWWSFVRLCVWCEDQRVLTFFRRDASSGTQVKKERKKREKKQQLPTRETLCYVVLKLFSKKYIYTAFCLCILCSHKPLRGETLESQKRHRPQQNLWCRWPQVKSTPPPPSLQFKSWGRCSDFVLEIRGDIYTETCYYL